MISIRVSRPLALLTILLATTAVHAGEFVYHPVNPSFGGNPMNGGALLSNAQAQDTNKSPETSGSLSNIDRLVSSLQSRLLSQLLSNIGAGETGSLVTDEYHIEVYEDPDGTAVITVEDFSTNQTTKIEVNGIAPQVSIK